MELAFEKLHLATLQLDFELSKSDAFSWSIFRLKTANFLSMSETPSGDYESEISTAIPSLYRCLGKQLLDINFALKSARIAFVGGGTFFICDQEGIWDNLFSVELENKDGRSE